MRRRTLPFPFALLALLALLPAAAAAESATSYGPAFILVLQGGGELEGRGGMVPVGPGLVNLADQVASGKPIPDGDVDWRATFFKNMDSLLIRALYIHGPSFIGFVSLRVDEAKDMLILKVDDKREVRIPARQVDFRTTVLEARGLAQGPPAATNISLLPRKSSGGPSSGGSSPAAGPSPRGPRMGVPARPAFSPPTPFEDDDSGSEPGDGGGDLGSFTPDAEPPVPMEPPVETPEVPPPPPAGGIGAPANEPGGARPRFGRAEVLTRTEPVYDRSLVPPGPGLTGLFEATVAPDGTVSNVKIVKSTGVPALDQAGIDAIRQWTYKPADKDGVPYESRKLERLVFRSEG